MWEETEAVSNRSHLLVTLAKTMHNLSNPTANEGMQNGSSVGTCTHCIHGFCTFRAILHAQSVLINKISAQELRRKFIKGPLLVGHKTFFLFLLLGALGARGWKEGMGHEWASVLSLLSWDGQRTLEEFLSVANSGSFPKLPPPPLFDCKWRRPVFFWGWGWGGEFKCCLNIVWGILNKYFFCLIQLYFA